MKRGLYAGSFDPCTFGHLGVVVDALRIFDEVVVAIAVNDSKKGTFDMMERATLIRETLRVCYPTYEHRIEVVPTRGLITDTARQHDCEALIRGLRAASEFDYEFAMNIHNRNMGNIPTFFVPASQDFLFVSSSTIRELAKYGQDVTRYVGEPVAEALKAKFSVAG